MALFAPRVSELDFSEVDWMWRAGGPLIPIRRHTWPLRDNNRIWGFLPEAVAGLDAGYYAMAIHALSEVDLYPVSGDVRADRLVRGTSRRRPVAHLAWSDDRASAEAARAYDGHDIRRVDPGTVR